MVIPNVDFIIHREPWTENGGVRYSVWCLRSEDSIAHSMGLINSWVFGFLCSVYFYIEPLGEIIPLAKHSLICVDSINSTVKQHC